jgi:hypothetical protein
MLYVKMKDGQTTAFIVRRFFKYYFVGDPQGYSREEICKLVGSRYAQMIKNGHPALTFWPTARKQR